LKSTRFFLFAAILSGVLFLPSASAQANISIVSGNGQVICPGCTNIAAGSNANIYFAPLQVKVTDASGRPSANQTVYWNFFDANNAGTFANTQTPASATSTTDSNGMAQVLPAIGAVSNASNPYYDQGTVQAAVANGPSATFYLTSSGAASGVFTPFVQVDLTGVPIYSTFAGIAGSSAPSFTVHVFTQTVAGQISGGGVPNVELRLVNAADGTSGPSSTIPSAYCATGPGADPYSVLTDASGTATCTPILGPVAGLGDVYAVIGSVQPSIGQSLSQPVGIFRDTGNMHLNVSAVSVGSVVPVSPTSAVTVTAGGSQQLTARVQDTSGNPLQAQGVTWSASPAGAPVTFTSSSQITGVDGTVNNVITLGAAASGQITVKATSTSNRNASASFTILAQQPVVLTVMTKVSGDSQTANTGASFPNPLLVQVNSTGGPAANILVQFSVTGSATLSTQSVPTNSSGQASVNVTAGSNAGTVTVTATATGGGVTVSQSFSLTVIPPGPSITASSFVNAADQQVGSLSPCSLAAVVGPGVAPTGSIPFLAGQSALAGSTITVNNVNAPLLWAGSAGNQQQIIFQVPCEVSAGNVQVTVNVNGGTATTTVALKPASPGIFRTTMSDGVARAIVIRPDGSLVSLTNPARRGDVVTALVTGLGAASPSAASNALPIPPPGAASLATGQVIVGVNNAGTPGTVVSQLSPDLVGVFQVTFQIPTNAPQANNVVFSIGVVPVGSSTAYYSAGSQIPIQ
jgi:uncharacterized protein (TIGR03437 family)